MELVVDEQIGEVASQQALGRSREVSGPSKAAASKFNSNPTQVNEDNHDKNIESVHTRERARDPARDHLKKK